MWLLVIVIEIHLEYCGQPAGNNKQEGAIYAYTSFSISEAAAAAATTTTLMSSCCYFPNNL